jgi:hypothetical protein
MPSNDNATKQQQELELLTAVYAEELTLEQDGRYHITINATTSLEAVPASVALELSFSMPQHYPSLEPPIYTIRSACLTRENHEQINHELHRLYVEAEGEGVIYNWIDW